jgi:putative transposase
MDGRGCWRDNIFVERLWRSLKYEEVYLHPYDSVSAATAGIRHYFTLYNTRRPHSSLTDRTPDDGTFPRCRLLTQPNPPADPLTQARYAVQRSGATSRIYAVMSSA